MATDDDAAAKAPAPPTPTPAPANDSKEAPRMTTTAPDRNERSESDRINERLTERIRQGTVPPPPPPAEAREPREAPRESREPRESRDPREDKLNETIRQRLEHLVPELVKKTFAAGMGAVFSTEEGIRKIAREVSLPDVVGYVASSADGAKDKVFEIVARETRDFLSNLNLTEEIAKILTTLSFEIKTEIRFIPNSERMVGAEPDVKASVKLKRNDKAIGDDEQRDSRSRLRFWRRDGGDATDNANDDDDNGGHDK
ncbi:MAG TPA: hypothetical protein VIV40_32985 [Kofleriaceae bacterium]